MAIKKLSQSFEDYLETIYIINKKKKVVRVKDVSEDLNVSLPSVNEAVKKLAKKRLASYKKYGLIKLTKKGEETAKRVYKKHQTLFLFLTKILGVNENESLRDACMMEHGLSKITLTKLTKFVNLELKNKKLKGGE